MADSIYERVCSAVRTSVSTSTKKFRRKADKAVSWLAVKQWGREKKCKLKERSSDTSVQLDSRTNENEQKVAWMQDIGYFPYRDVSSNDEIFGMKQYAIKHLDVD